MTLHEEETRLRNARIISRNAGRRIVNYTMLGRLKEAHELSRKLTAILRVLSKPPRKSKTKFNDAKS